MKFFTVTHPTNIKQNGRRYPGALGRDVDTAIPVPEPTHTHNQESSHTIQFLIELNSLHYKGQALRQLIEDRLPDPIPGPSMTTTNALHDLHFCATLGLWDSFEMNVRDTSSSIVLPDNVLSCAPLPAHLSPFHLSNEQVFCGNEISVQGRFALIPRERYTAVMT
jgi:hypothetical protein